LTQSTDRARYLDDERCFVLEAPQPGAGGGTYRNVPGSGSVAEGEWLRGAGDYSSPDRADGELPDVANGCLTEPGGGFVVIDRIEETRPEPPG
jgi:hypothetical protein